MRMLMCMMQRYGVFITLGAMIVLLTVQYVILGESYVVGWLGGALLTGAYVWLAKTPSSVVLPDGGSLTVRLTLGLTIALIALTGLGFAWLAHHVYLAGLPASLWLVGSILAQGQQPANELPIPTTQVPVDVEPATSVLQVSGK